MKRSDRFITAFSLLALQLALSLTTLTPLAASRSRMFQNFLKKEHGLTDSEVNYITKGKNEDNTIIQPETFTKRLNRIKQSNAADEGGGDQFVTELKANPHRPAAEIIADIKARGDAKKLVRSAGLDPNNVDFATAAKACAKIPEIGEIGRDKIEAAVALIAAGLSETYLSAAYINAYIADGEDRAAALLMAASNAESFTCR